MELTIRIRRDKMRREEGDKKGSDEMGREDSKGSDEMRWEERIDSKGSDDAEHSIV